MDLIQIIVLAVLQGLTEFLPISSSAHLILTPRLLGWHDQGLAFDVAVHVGTLSAVLLYMRRELAPMITDTVATFAGKPQTQNSRLAWGVVLATLPVGIAGIVFKDYIETQLRSPLIIATATIVFAIALWLADRKIGRRDEHGLSLKESLLIGLAQAVALIPGTSRSGITITAGLMLGLTRQSAARFSFLLSIPTITAAGLLKTRDLLESPLPVDWNAIVLGTALSAVSAYVCIHLFLKMLERLSMTPFVIYRLLLGAVLFILFA